MWLEVLELTFSKNIKVPFDYISYVYFGDTYYQAMLVEHGDFAILNDVTAVWRKHSEGVFGSIADDRKRPLNLHRSQTQMWISQQFLMMDRKLWLIDIWLILFKFC